MSPEIKIFVVIVFMLIIIIGELIFYLKQKLKFCKGQSTVGFIVRKHLYSSNSLNDDFINVKEDECKSIDKVIQDLK